MSQPKQMYPIEAILYRWLTETDWRAIHGRAGRSGTGGGERHIALNRMVASTATSRFLQTSVGPVSIIASAIGGTQENAELVFKDWGGNRNQWTLSDQRGNRHPAITTDYGFPRYEDTQLWDSSGKWLGSVVVYWVRCPGPQYFMGYHIGVNAPSSWPNAMAGMFSARERPGIGLIEGKPMSYTICDMAVQVLQTLDKHPNILLYGPPGTGKTRIMQDVFYALQRENLMSLALEPSDQDQPFKEAGVTLPLPTPVYTDWITFHQSTTYEEFVVGLRPLPINGGVKLQPRAGRLLEAINYVLSNGGSAVLFIDELNRGNPAQVFGEFITFLERDKRSSPPINSSEDPGNKETNTLPFYLPGVDYDPQTGRSQTIAFRQGESAINFPIHVPYHLYIVASMNSLDRSVAPLDQALARRFFRLWCPPDWNFLLDKMGLPLSCADLDSIVASDEENSAGLAAVLLLRRVNRYLSHLMGPDFQFGHGYLSNVWKASEGPARWNALVTAWDSSILPQLEEMFRTRSDEFATILRADSNDQPPEYPYRLSTLTEDSIASDTRVFYEAEALTRIQDAANQRRALKFLASKV